MTVKSEEAAKAPHTLPVPSPEATLALTGPSSVGNQPLTVTRERRGHTYLK